MRVFVADHDLFNAVGGGQTVYRSLVMRNPGIDFYYIAEQEPLDSPRPANAHAIPGKQFDLPYLNREDFYDLSHPRWLHDHFHAACRIAFIVKGMSFDVVEVPDYKQFGCFLPPALHFFGVSFERLVLSMHGSLSESQKHDWPSVGRVDIPLDIAEEWQFRAADLRYAISPAYSEEWQRNCPGRKIHYLEPLSFLEMPVLIEDYRRDTLVSINFLGRLERRKGPDIFLDLLSLLSSRSCAVKGRIIGPPHVFAPGQDATDILRQDALNRGIEVEMVSGMTKNEMAALFATRAITVVPSRYDSFNLVALESLFSGCPAVVASAAGITGYLRENFPRIPFISLDISNLGKSLPEIRDLIENYDTHRAELLDAVRGSAMPAPGTSLEGIYKSAVDSDSGIRDQAGRWFEKMVSLYYDHEDRKSVKLRYLGKHFAESVLRLNRNSRNADDRSPWDVYKMLFELPEKTERNISEKIAICWSLASSLKVDRCRIWHELSRLERMRGNKVLAATYKLRVMRILGDDHFGDLDDVAGILEENGYGGEAKAARAMFGNNALRDKACGEFLDEALASNKSNEEKPWEFVDDRRGSRQPVVSIIVSLYNAAEKLPLFFRNLSAQTLHPSGAIEIVLIDSGSPGNEYEVFKNSFDELRFPAVYARSKDRESIQSAWNRGIALSRGRYLSFLGVDETVAPQAYEILASELDRDPSTDWVMASSVVVDINNEGQVLREVMTYNRTGYQQDFVYLETCYLSWVGGLYRRSIHERFGYYDASFRAAGDTEFKGRVLPFIKTREVPGVLGIFLNYPEVRTTESPRAEIEDLRAWYLHRTFAGVCYAFSRRNREDAERVLMHALCYRKSYTNHLSSDFEYASALARFIQASGESHISALFPGIEMMIEGLRQIDWLPVLTPFAFENELVRVQSIAQSVGDEHKRLSQGALGTNYALFNDNRYEQHYWPWKIQQELFSNREGSRYLWK